MRDYTTVFDHEGDAAADAADDLTREFWGNGAGWIAPGHDAGRSRSSVLQLHRGDGPPPSFDLDHTPASLRGIRDGFAAFRPKRRWRDDPTGPIERTREHGVIRAGRPASAATVAAAVARGPRRPSPELLPHRDASIGDLAAGHFDEASVVEPVMTGDDELIALVPAADLTPPRHDGVDPMVVRIALVVIALLVAIPLALVLRNSNEPTVETDVGQVPAVGDAPVESGVPSDAAAVPPATGDATVRTTGAPSGQAAPMIDASSGATTPAVAAATVAETDTAPVDAQLTEAQAVEPIEDAPGEVSAVVAPATVDEVADRAVPDCSRTYTASPGDSWYRIADAAGVTPQILMEQNRATVDTVILPGEDICLPPGAAMPTPPTTAATATPTTVAKAATPTTAAPKTTAAPRATTPTTTTPPPPASSPAEVQAMIREIWPDDLEERALEIAHRESKFRSAADNGSCCVGVFQLYWTAHSSWLDDYGIHSRNDLKDARKNITAAYGLYQRSGGWGPWGG